MPLVRQTLLLAIALGGLLLHPYLLLLSAFDVLPAIPRCRALLRPLAKAAPPVLALFTAVSSSSRTLPEISGLVFKTTTGHRHRRAHAFVVDPRTNSAARLTPPRFATTTIAAATSAATSATTSPTARGDAPPEREATSTSTRSAGTPRARSGGRSWRRSDASAASSHAA